MSGMVLKPNIVMEYLGCDCFFLNYLSFSLIFNDDQKILFKEKRKKKFALLVRPTHVKMQDLLTVFQRILNNHRTHYYK